MTQKQVAQTKAKRKPPSVFKKNGWIVDNEMMHSLEDGKIQIHRQYPLAILTFTDEPKRWGTLLSKVIEAIKDGGEIYFLPTMTDKFLLVSAAPKRGFNEENFWYIKVSR